MPLILRKVLQLIAVLFLVTFLTSTLIRLLPGDPVITIGGLAAENDPERRAEIENDLGLDKNIVAQYGQWLGDAASGDFGESYVSGDPALDLIRDRMPVTLQLLLYSQVLALLIALPLGVATAYRADSWVDRFGSLALFGMLAVPVYIAGVLLKLFFTTWLTWFPPLFSIPFSQDPVEHFKSMFLPSLSLALGLVPIYARVLRTDMIATLKEDFIDVARAKGLPPIRILTRHALRPSSFSLLTVAGIAIGNLIGGSIVVEVLFALDGVGLLLIDSIVRDDYIVLQAGVTIIAVAFVLINFTVDLLYTVLDPRIRKVGSNV